MYMYVYDRELLEMRSRLYLNLGLVYQHNGDPHTARKFMEKALSIVKYVHTKTLSTPLAVLSLSLLLPPESCVTLPWFSSATSTLGRCTCRRTGLLSPCAASEKL